MLSMFETSEKEKQTFQKKVPASTHCFPRVHPWAPARNSTNRAAHTHAHEHACAHIHMHAHIYFMIQSCPQPAWFQECFPADPMTHFFAVRVTEHWHRLPREAIESPCLNVLKSHLDMVLGSWLRVALLGQGVWTR